MARHVADRVVKLILGKGISVLNARVLVLGLAFKENCPDVRNSKVVDIVRGLRELPHAPWTRTIPGSTRTRRWREYGIECVPTPEPASYDAIVLAVAHRQFVALGPGQASRRLGKPGCGHFRREERAARGHGGRAAVAMKVIVTGAAGFIGMHVCQRLLARGDTVVGIDNLNDYYDPTLKRARLARLEKHGRLQFQPRGRRRPRRPCTACSRSRTPQARRPSRGTGGRALFADKPCCLHRLQPGRIRQHAGRLPPRGVEHLVYASSSSVYGGNTRHALQRAPERRPPCQPVRGDQEGQRADGPQLQPPVPAADHGPALLHGVRTLGPAGHGLVPVHQGDAGRATRSTSSTTAKCCATSPTSTTSWRESSA